VQESCPSHGSPHYAYGAFDPDERDQLLREWLQGDSPLYYCCCLQPSEWPGEWLRELAVLIEQAARRRPFEAPHPGPWELWMRQGRFSVRAVASRPDWASAVILAKPESYVGVRLLWQWLRMGAREVWFREPRGWKQCHLPSLWCFRLAQKTARLALPGASTWLGLDTPSARTRLMLKVRNLQGHRGPPEIRYSDLTTPVDGLWRDWVDAADERAIEPFPDCRPLKIVEYIATLNSGGAERQLCNVALGLARRGIDVRVRTSERIIGANGHYVDLLRSGRVPVGQAGAQPLSPTAAMEIPWHLVRAVPAHLRDHVFALAAELATAKPDVLHGWLDQTSIVAGVAGLLTGVRSIVLGLRSLNPSHVAHLDAPFLRPWYGILARSSRISFVANSRAAAASYADWIGISRERVAVIPNGLNFSHFPQPSPAAREHARRELDLHAADRVVSGILRFSEEKQPELFLEVVRRARAGVSNLRVLLVGTGPLKERVDHVVRSEGMSDYVRLLGRRSDIGTILLASDANLLSSRLEGCPNVTLEAQHLGVPVVATAVGGTPEAVVHGQTGLLAAVNDADGLARHLIEILTNDALRARLGSAGPGHVAARFGLERMVDETIALYRQAHVRHSITKEIPTAA